MQILNKTEIIIKEYIHIFVGILFLIGIGNLTLNIERRGKINDILKSDALTNKKIDSVNTILYPKLDENRADSILKSVQENIKIYEEIIQKK